MNRRAFFRRTVGGLVAAVAAPLLPPAPTRWDRMLSGLDTAVASVRTRGWGQPTTWVTGELVTAALMNEHIRDNLLYLRDEACERS